MGANKGGMGENNAEKWENNKAEKERLEEWLFCLFRMVK